MPDNPWNLIGIMPAKGNDFLNIQNRVQYVDRFSFMGAVFLF
jgi:hypothetical protein